MPGKKAASQAGWSIQSKLQVYLWLGLSKHKKDFLNGLPHGYEESRALKIAVKPQCVPPSFILYTGNNGFILVGSWNKKFIYPPTNEIKRGGILDLAGRSVGR